MAFRRGRQVALERQSGRAAGFNGSVDYLTSTLIPECASKKSFKIKTIAKILNIESSGTLKWDELRGLDGKTARKRVKDYLDSSRLN
ncbi:MAG: hypothetical protein ACPG5T_05335, partial [Endozoicomonas sp.]